MPRAVRERLARTLQSVAWFLERGFADRAFDELATAPAHPTTTALLSALHPLARTPAGITYTTPELHVQALEKRDQQLAAARSAQTGRALDEDERAFVSSIEAQLRPRRADEPSLWAAVYAEPDDDRPRLVLADALIERGDPRGELIALQIESAKTGRPSARERELLRLFSQVFLGILRFDVGHAVFRRGFVAEGKYVGARYDFSRPEWSTLELLDFGSAIAHRELLALPRLRRSYCVSEWILEKALERGLVLSLQHTGYDSYQPRYDEAWLRDALARVLPRLRRMDVFRSDQPANVERLLRVGVPVVGMEDALSNVRTAAALLARAEPDQRLVCGLRGAWPHYDEDPSRWSLTLSGKTALSIDATLFGEGTADELLAALAGLPVERLVLHRRGRPRATAEERARLLAEARRLLSIEPTLQTF